MAGESKRFEAVSITTGALPEPLPIVRGTFQCVRRFKRVVTAATAAGLVVGSTATACSSFGSATPDEADASLDRDALDADEADASLDRDVLDAADALAREYLYIFGGTPIDGYRAETLSDGQLGVWERVPALDMLRDGFGSVNVPAGLIAVAGNHLNEAGVVAAYDVNSVEFAPYDGGFGTWRPAPPLPVGRGAIAVASTSAFLYAVGGSNAGNRSANVFVSSLSSGGPSAWSTLVSDLPAPSIVTSVVSGGRLYAVGIGSASPTEVASAATLADGAVGEWIDAGTIGTLADEAVGSEALVLAGSRLHALGGRDFNNGASAKVWTGTIDAPSGAVSWVKNAPLPTPTSGPCAVGRGDLVYVLGGLGIVTPGTASDAVAVGRVDAAGTITWKTLSPLPQPRSGFGCAIR